jgi:hypothetical protein
LQTLLLLSWLSYPPNRRGAWALHILLSTNIIATDRVSIST